ncbi:unnamed protein product [Nippostrongylus brasiliensis]|uniref:Transmembrane protein n=1 Tax=Nippostrongylus brasiliensis TaxID=27835 RepID=A0A0N4YBC2_NIPBR|nr:unnamed protein product [Nippostrongylus brasiliensis]
MALGGFFLLPVVSEASSASNPATLTLPGQLFLALHGLRFIDRRKIHFSASFSHFRTVHGYQREHRTWMVRNDIAAACALAIGRAERTKWHHWLLHRWFAAFIFWPISVGLPTRQHYPKREGRRQTASARYIARNPTKTPLATPPKTASLGPGRGDGGGE